MNFRFLYIRNQWLPSVTSNISLKPNPALKKWKSNFSEEQIRLVSEDSAERGSIIHYGALRTYETETKSCIHIHSIKVRFNTIIYMDQQES